MISKESIDRALRPLGMLLAAAAVVFLFIVARRHWAALADIAVSPRQWAVIAGLSLLYGSSLFLLALAWHLILGCAGARPPGARHSIHAYATAQLAKYVPGNVFHLLGRHLIHRAAGMDDKRLAIAALVEAVLMLAAAACVAGLSAAFDPPEFLRSLSAVTAAATGVLVLAMLHLARRLAGCSLAQVLAAFLACLAFFAIMGGVVAALVGMLGDSLSLAVGGSGVAAWIAGFVTPGAPGGLGVREAAMVLLGGGDAKAEVLLLAAALFRLITFAGDLVCFASGRLFFRPATSQP